ncbi:HAMP domain-containing protein, partial [Desulfococcus sp.]|uniref:HAMP domain-containing protein n=1 Tax=Desulfococcus sp. TaxID=2025834 RepID=UPI0035943DA5
MASPQPRRRGVGIALRIALLSWLLALTTLVIFVVLTYPQQKRTFLKNLESKANSVAVSLHDVAAGAAINEDFASVVSAGQTMLDGDPDLDFLIVMKNDGFSLVIEQTGWKVEPEVDAYWLPQQREAVGDIAMVPLLNRRVFHFAQPFDYSGIQWGWIHVGLSLEGYDRSVATLYYNTVMLGVACIVFSLLASLAYAGHLVRPILRLRHVVQQIAGGDLSVRADMVRHDELGSLAESVNTMTEALLRRDLILESVRFAAEQFMRAAQWEMVITLVLGKIGHAADVSRAYVFENQMDEAGRLCTRYAHEWTAQGIRPEVNNPELQVLPYTDAGFGRWIALLGNNEIISGLVAEMSPAERAVLEPQDVLSLIAIPVFVEGVWWGFLGLDDCVRERVWTDAEQGSLRAGADMLGATIARQHAQEALLDAKVTLEQRVLERTRELQEQVAAKEQALAELASAQGSLLEMSRAAGMAEVATGVLHNVGNVLNSVNVSCTLLMEQLRESRVGNVSRVAGLMAEPEGGLAHFLTEDPRGRQIPAYLASLAAVLQEEQEVVFREAESL